MNEPLKQPLVLSKIDKTLELIEKLADVLQPVLCQQEEEKIATPYIPSSLVLERLDLVNERLEIICKKIDIN